MKRLFFWSIAAVGLLFSACTKDDAAEPQQPAGKTERLYLSDEVSEADSQSRAGFDGNGYHIAWEAGDHVAINYQDKYELQQDESGRWFVELPSAESYTVYYPAESYYGTSLAEGYEIFQLPFDQSYRTGSFDKAAFAARAVAQQGEKLVFKYMCSVLKLTLRGTSAEQVKSIRVDAVGDEKISYVCDVVENGEGVAYLQPTTAQLYQSMPRSYVTLNVDNVPLTAQGVDFYMTLMPTTFSQGFRITVRLADGRGMIKEGGVGQRADRGKILAMPALDFAEGAPLMRYSTNKGLTYVNWTFGTNDPVNYYSLKVQTFGTARLTYDHLAVLKKNMGSYQDGIVNLDLSEAMFESEALGNAAFKGATLLRSIVLPANVTRLECPDTGVFDGCTKLQTVTLGAKFTAIRELSFNGCPVLTKIEYPGQTIPNKLPATCTVVSPSAFKGCSSLKKLWMPVVSAMNSNVFIDCTSLSIVIFGEPSAPTQSFNFTNINTFQNCTGLKNLGIYTTGMSGLSSTGAFNGAAKPILSVPAGLVNSYKENANWSSVVTAVNSTDLTTVYNDTAL